MSAHWRTDETKLRRNLLFRLLVNFDFDNLVFQYEPISTATPEQKILDDSDTFIFAPRSSLE